MGTLSYRDYLDRVKGAWAGKCAGGIIGAKSENNKGLLSYTFDTVFPEVIPTTILICRSSIWRRCC